MFKEGELVFVVGDGMTYKGRIARFFGGSATYTQVDIAGVGKVGHCPVSSLTAPPEHFYVSLPTKDREDWSKRLQEAAFKAGVVWPTSPTNEVRAYSNIKFLCFEDDLSYDESEGSFTEETTKLTPEDAFLVLESRAKVAVQGCTFANTGPGLEVTPTTEKEFPAFSYKWESQEEFEAVEKVLLEYGYEWVGLRDTAIELREFYTSDNDGALYYGSDSEFKTATEIYSLLGVEEPKLSVDEKTILKEAVAPLKPEGIDQWKAGDWFTIEQHAAYGLGTSGPFQVIGFGASGRTVCFKHQDIAFHVAFENCTPCDPPTEVKRTTKSPLEPTVQQAAKAVEVITNQFSKEKTVSEPKTKTQKVKGFMWDSFTLYKRPAFFMAKAVVGAGMWSVIGGVVALIAAASFGVIDIPMPTINWK